MRHLIPTALLLAAVACSSPPPNPPDDSGWTTVDQAPTAPVEAPADPAAVVVQLYDVRDLTGAPSDSPLGIEGIARLLEDNVPDAGITTHEQSLLIVQGPAHAHREVALLLRDLRGE